MLRPCPPHTCAYSHWLTLPIRQRSPQPFYRAKLESPQPPHTQGDLDEEDGDGEEQAQRRSHLAKEGEAVAIEDRGADEREMGGDILEDPAPPGIQAQQEECEHIGIVDIRRYVPRQFARSESDLLSIGPARVNAPVVVDGLLIVRLGLVRNPALQRRTYSMGDRGVRREAEEEQGNGEQGTSGHEQCLGRESAKEQQDKAILRVIMQDVAVPQE